MASAYNFSGELRSSSFGLLPQPASAAATAAITAAVVAMAQRLHLDVVAEGVETLAQHDFLLNQGCDHFQGHLFSRPLPIDQLECYLMAHAGGASGSSA